MGKARKIRINELRDIVAETINGLDGTQVPGLDDDPSLDLSDDVEFDNMSQFINDVVTWLRKQAKKSSALASQLGGSGYSSGADSAVRAATYIEIADAIDNEFMFDSVDDMAMWLRTQVRERVNRRMGQDHMRIRTSVWNYVADKVERHEF